MRLAISAGTLVLSSLAVGCGSAAPVPDSVAVPLTTASLDAGAELFERHCALCHGPSGAGDGPAAALLFPPARDFTRARFRLVGTDNGVPSDDDLIATMRRGIPGSAMPSWDWLDDQQLLQLARHVRTLATEGLADRLLAADANAELGEVWADAVERTTPGEEVEPFLVLAGATARERQARGHELFMANCAPCHGADGRGGDATPRWNEDGSLNWARDFTAGILKGGSNDHAIAQRILLGLPGTAMPPTELEPEDLAAVVDYVQSLLPPGSADELVQLRRRIVCERVEGRVPWTPGDPRWEAVAPTAVVLSPLFWSHQAVFHADVRAVHNGAQIAVHLTWADDTADGLAGGPTPFPDACALLFSEDEHPPVFGMGAEGHSTGLWHWRSAGVERVAETSLPPHAFAESARTSMRFHRARPWTDGEVRTLESQGFDQLSETDGGEVRVRARRSAEGWEVVLVRLLATGRPEDVALVPGEPISLGCAIWNGSAGEHRGRKSVTIWHELVLER